MTAARTADKLLTAAIERGSKRWIDFLAPVPELLRDAGVGELARITLRVRAAYGVKDSIRDVLPPDLTEPFLDQLDRLRKALAREVAER
ncbi:MAG TPA: hypothetical protein VF375_08340 [Candidatus Limnocylindrales bacterium]|jgi:hypothetical protein